MTSIEELIRQKLSAALQEERQRIAASLLETSVRPVVMTEGEHAQIPAHENPFHDVASKHGFRLHGSTSMNHEFDKEVATAHRKSFPGHKGPVTGKVHAYTWIHPKSGHMIQAWHTEPDKGVKIQPDHRFHLYKNTGHELATGNHSGSLDKSLGALHEMALDDKPAGTETKPDPAAAENKRKAKGEKIARLRDQLNNVQSKVAAAKDPAAMKERIETLRQKLQLAQQEMSQIK